MTSREFLNRARGLHCLDFDQVRFLGAERWPLFRNDPIGFLIRADDATADQIWAALEKDQSVTA